MNCREVQELLSAYLDGYLGSAEKKELEKHLKSCNKCLSELETLQHTIRLLNSLREEKITPPPELKNNIMEYVRSENSYSFWHNRFLLRKVAIAAVFLLVLAGSYYFYQVNSFSPKLASETKTVEIPADIIEEQAQNGVQEQNLPLLKITGKGVEEAFIQLYKIDVSSAEDRDKLVEALKFQIEAKEVTIEDEVWVGISDTNLTRALQLVAEYGLFPKTEKIDPLEKANELKKEIMELEDKKNNFAPQSQQWQKINFQQQSVRQKLEIITNWPFRYYFQIQLQA